MPERPTRSTILARGLALRCPGCGGPHLFRRAPFFLNRRCPACGAELERGDGFYLGALSLNYGLTITLWLVPVLAAWMLGWIGGRLATGLAIGGAVVLPAALYGPCRSLWLAIYYAVLPQELPEPPRPPGVPGTPDGPPRR